MSLNPLTWTWNEKKSAGRHALNTAATVVATVAGMHFLPPGFTDGLTEILNGIDQIIKGIGAVVAAVLPLYTLFKAAHSASPKEEAKSLTNLPAEVVKEAVASLPDTDNRNKLINGVSKMEEVRAIVTPEAVAHSTDSEKVVSSPAQVQLLPLAVPRVG